MCKGKLKYGINGQHWVNWVTAVISQYEAFCLMGELSCQPWGFCMWSGTLTTFTDMLWWVDHSWMPAWCSPSYPIILPLIRTVGAENRMENLVEQNKSSLIKQKQRLCGSKGKKKGFFFYFPPGDNVQTLLGKQGFTMHRSFFRYLLWIVNIPFSFLLAFTAEQILCGIE